MKKYNIAIVNGDGIGHEIVPASWKVLEAVAAAYQFELTSSSFPWGAGYYKEHGEFMPSDGLDTLAGFDAILFGAVGLPEVDDTLPFKLYTAKVRTHFQQYVNYRPVKLLAGVEGPLRSKKVEDIDFVVLRENTEGEFVQNGKIFYPEEPHGLATETNVFTRAGIERVAHYAFQLARKRRNHVTNVTKSNTMIHTLAYWDHVMAQVAAQYPDVTYRKMYVDAASANFVLRPEIFDVVLTTNMIGDILSDLGGAIMGSLGLGPSGNLRPEKDKPSMFEPIHGSAPDIAGQGIANPVGQIWSGALMLEHLGEEEAASAIVGAIEKTLQDGIKTKDLGGNASTQDVAEAVIANLSVPA
ncbi:MAG: tartrate dehydrogenase [Saprospiraceae bacterium]|nr:tartrate dehydrogenase [Saprospiraceae bacterium]